MATGRRRTCNWLVFVCFVDLIKSSKSNPVLCSVTVFLKACGIVLRYVVTVSVIHGIEIKITYQIVFEFMYARGL